MSDTTATISALDAKEAAKAVYAVELDWALGKTDHDVDVAVPRERAVRKLVLRYPDAKPSELWAAILEGHGRHVERTREVTADVAQLAIGSAIRIADRVLVPVDKAHRLDWEAWYERHEAKWREHDAAFARLTEFFLSLMRRFRGAPDGATTLEVAADLFDAAPEAE